MEYSKILFKAAFLDHRFGHDMRYFALAPVLKMGLECPSARETKSRYRAAGSQECFDISLALEISQNIHMHTQRHKST